jgi:YggT family protein
VLNAVLAVDFVLAVYAWLAFALMVLGWLKGFNVINDGTHGVAFISKYLGILVEPLLRPLRKIVPNVGTTIDGTPYVLLLIIMAVRYAAAFYLIPRLFRYGL